MLKDQPKCKTTRDPPNCGSRSLKTSNFEAEKLGDESVGGNERPEGRKAMKQRLRERANNIIVDLVATVI